MKLRATILLLVILLVTPSVFANEAKAEEIEQERIDLFLASRQMLAEERTPPKMKVGMVLSNLGADSEITFGMRIESGIGRQNVVRVITETTCLKQEQTLAGFLSVKFALCSKEPAMYLGGGAGYADGFRYQLFAGVDLTKNFFAEARYINLEGGLANKGLYLATGFQLTF